MSVLHLPDGEDLDSTWKVLQSGLDKIFEGENIDMQTYMTIYTSIHNFCFSGKAISRAGSQPVAGSAHRVLPPLGEDLYRRLSTYLTQALSTIHKGAEKLTGEQLLDYYNEQWSKFLACSRFNHYLWAVLGRNWIKRELDEGKKDIYSIFDLHLREWKLEMLDTMHENLAEILLSLIKRQRDGEYVEQLPRKSFINSIMTLRKFDDEDIYGNEDKVKIDRLTREWEELFRSSTTEYYEKAAVQGISQYCPGEYIDRVERRVLDEERNTALFLPDHMKFSILRTCEKILITDHLDLYLSYFTEVIPVHDPSKLGQVYRLLRRVPNGLDTCYERFEKHARDAGLEAVEDAVASATINEEAKDQGETVDYCLFSQTLSRVIKKYQTLVKVALNSDKEFNRSVDRACRAFVNWNRACIYDSDAPELLAKHTESLLRDRSGRAVSESDILDKLADSALIFKYLEDKDAFVTLYSRMLAKRLVQGSSVSKQAERAMLSKMQEVYDHIGKLKQMLLDMDIAKDLDSRFEQWRLTRGITLQDLSLEHQSDQSTVFTRSFKVLSQANWPLKPSNTPFIIPTTISQAHNEFLQFYQGEHPGRILHWHWNLCHGDMRIYLKGGSSQGYTLHASAYQIAILLLFNEKDPLSYEEIKEGTGLLTEDLSPLLSFFLKTTLLKLEDRDSTKWYTINTDFTSKKVKIDIRVSLKKQKNAEIGELHRKIREERKLLMQATIVRVMKSRRKLTYQQLALETICQLQTRFAPKDTDLKSCVDLLIDKEFLERMDNGDLEYLA